MTDPTPTKTTAKDVQAMAEPVWYREHRETYLAGAAHGFILSGDIYGQAVAGVSQRSYLEAALSHKREIVVRYERARGFAFALESMRPVAEQYVEQDADPRTRDEEAMLDAISSMFGSQGVTIGDQVPGDGRFSGLPEPKAALRTLEQLLRAPKARNRVAVIIDLAELIAPNQDQKAIMSPDDRDALAILLGWGQDTTLGKCNNPVFLLVAQLSELHLDLRSSGSGYKVIDVPLPTGEERLVFITRYLKKREEAKEKQAPKPIPLLDLNVSEMANLTAGLNLRHIEDILLLGYRSGGVTRLLVKARKDAIITSEFSEVAEMIEPLPSGFAALGGMDHLISWARTELIAPLTRGGEDAPKGVLLVGPPGTGKTFWVRALAQEIGFNAVMLRSENILGKYVGESEGKLKRFFAFARALTPCLIFFDELDQSDMSQRGNASGNPVATNLFNMMLQFMSDETLRGKMVVFFASNRPDLIDPALLRFGRMDAIIPVLLPDEEARCGIVRAQARSQATLIEEEAVQRLATRTEQYSAADLAATVAKAKKLARRAERTAITVDDVEQALGFIRPQTPQFAKKYTLMAIEACNDAELLPAKYAALLANRSALKAQIRETEREAEEVPAATRADEAREDRSW